VGAIIERPDLYKYLSAFENLRLFAIMSGIRPTSRELMSQLEMVGLAERAHSKVKTYSQGMKQRLGIATALIHNPELIILDEPTNGLDPQGIADIRNLILHLSREQRKTLLVSSHLLHEIELIADSMLIIDKGRKVAEGPVSELFNPAETVVELKTLNDVEAYSILKASSLSSYVLDKKSDLILLKMHRDQIPWAIQQVVAMNVKVLSFHSRHSLEDYFLSLTSDNQHVEAFTN
jgi:ABC-type multidrug transport system ATPase subunit